jgi:ferritin-like protein
VKEQHPLMQFFEHEDGRPPHIQKVYMTFWELAYWANANLPDNSEKTTALRKLLEALDCAVRAHLYQD